MKKTWFCLCLLVSVFLTISSASAITRPNGSVIKMDSSPAVYYVQDHNMRPVTSELAFISNGLRWDHILTITETEFLTYPLGEDLYARCGTLIKGSGPAVFVVDYDGFSYLRKRWITSPEAFNGFGYHWEDVITISDAELGRYPLGGDVRTDSLRPNGQLIKTPGNPTVYWLVMDYTSGRRYACPIRSSMVFDSYVFRWDRITEIPDAEFDLINPAGFIYARPSTPIKIASNATVYITDYDPSTGYQRSPIPNAEAFESLGLHWDEIHTVSDTELEDYPIPTLHL